ncbi:hypothetical protein IscW_ISCW019317 [Ixodes scapularis]|uniref:Uncharacterized protein n=1 Tax=Ixodes scapularis TaxID=6945 RepID=B7PW55_IXOSC|nr:hypothetical protein IscW_ISCW019317 [Ixodes scapularis]|eukprot:XP_002409310.1 hypothetical protein IscW_ISCW019317 [Ixodes scapularis]
MDKSVLNPERYLIPSEAEEPELSTSGAAESCASDNPDPYVSDVDDMEEELRSTGTDVTFGEFVATDFNLTTCDPQTVPCIMPEIRQGEVSGKDNDEDEELEEAAGSYVRPGRRCIGFCA